MGQCQGELMANCPCQRTGPFSFLALPISVTRKGLMLLLQGDTIMVQAKIIMASEEKKYGLCHGLSENDNFARVLQLLSFVVFID